MSSGASAAPRTSDGRARSRTIPWISLSFVATALAASAADSTRSALVFDRAGFDRGHWWRLWTAHLVHSWPAVAALDLGVIAVLGVWVEQRSRVALVSAVLSSAVAASLAVLFLRPDLATYQGSSAIACALFTLVGVRISIRGPSAFARSVSALALGAFAIKTWLELARDDTWSVVPLSDGVEVVGIAHAAGGIAGVVVGWLTRRSG